MAPWNTILSWRTLFTIGVIYKFTFMWYSTKQGTMHRPTSHLEHLHTMPFLWPRDEQRHSRVQWLSLTNVGYGDSRAVRLLRPHLVSQPIQGWSDLGFFLAFSIKFLTWRSLKSRWVYLAPHEDVRIQLLSTVRSRRRKNNFMVHLKLCQLIK